MFWVHIAFGQSVTQQGWPVAMSELYYDLDAQPEKNYVVLISLLPTKVMDLRTGNKMRDSMNQLNFQKDYHPGHEMIGWKCQIGSANHSAVIGFNGERQNQMQTLIKNGWGMTSLLATFQDGILETPNELQVKFEFIQKELAENPKSKSFLTTTVLEITAAECSELLNEVHNYTSHPEKPLKNFSIFSKTENYEGAVCNSFASHLLATLKSLAPIVKNFKRAMSLPAHLFHRGHGDLPPDTEIQNSLQQKLSHKPLPSWQMVLRDWSPTVLGQVDFNLTDPELILFWQRKMLSAYFGNKKLNQIDFLKNTPLAWRGLWPKKNDSSGTDSLDYIQIDKDFDQYTQSINTETDLYLKNKILAFKIRDHFPVLIVQDNN